MEVDNNVSKQAVQEFMAEMLGHSNRILSYTLRNLSEFLGKFTTNLCVAGVYILWAQKELAPIENCILFLIGPNFFV